MLSELTEIQVMIKDLARDFAERELAPKAKMVEEEAIFPRESFYKMAELGLTGLTTPEEYGGVGQGHLTYSLVMEEIARKCINNAGILSAHMTAQYMIERYGNPEHKQKYLRFLAQGQRIGALCLTEPGSGSDAASLQSTAVYDESRGEYVINGNKIFITSGGEAEIHVVLARTGQATGSRGISAFIVEKGNPGLSFGRKEQKMAYNGSPTREVFFQDCRVPKADLLGREGEGFKFVMDALDGGRISVAAIAVGLSQAALDEAVAHLNSRAQFGQKIGTFQGLQFMIADMATAIEASRALVYRAARRKDLGLPASTEASMAKLMATDTAMNVTTNAVQLFGGYGYTKDYPVERYMRQAKIFQIVEGTNQIQRVVIARKIMGG